jgi:hypothetical protein
MGILNNDRRRWFKEQNANDADEHSKKKGDYFKMLKHGDWRNPIFLQDKEMAALERIFKNPGFNKVFSFILGLGLVALFRPICHGDLCRILKAPPIDEINASTYQIGSKCYQFRTKTIDCPAKGVVESFTISRF